MELFDAFKLRDLEFRNRIGVSPMCQYSAVDGSPNDWHLVHLGSRAVGGAGLVMAEATAVEARGRISPGDAGLYLERHVDEWRKVTSFVRGQGAVAAVQLAHAGRKASVNIPWKGGESLEPQSGGWDDLLAPSSIAFDSKFRTPREISKEEIKVVTESFRMAAERALAAGFQVVEIHAAHGYLLHEFLSPLSNTRTDEYGGPFENRIRFLCEVLVSVRKVWPVKWPVFVRISASDWVDGGWSIQDSVSLCCELKKLGADLVDVSSGGNISQAKISLGPGYQVQFSERIRREANIATAAVGMISDSKQADQIVKDQQADMIFIGREFLRDPYWPRRAASELQKKIHVPQQYLRAW